MSESLDINDRVRQVRLHFGYNQKVFGELLGLSVGGLSGIEVGRRNVNERIIIILKGMGVSENWLRTGEGSMFDPDSEADRLENALCFEALPPEKGDLELIRKYMHLEPGKRQAIRMMCGIA